MPLLAGRNGFRPPQKAWQAAEARARMWAWLASWTNSPSSAMSLSSTSLP